MSGFQSWGMDARLVHSTLSGDNDAFARLVERHLPTVEAVALSCTRNFADAQDISQETFLKAYQSLDSLKERGKFGPWVVTIARNAGLRFAQRRSREIPLADAAIAEPAVQPDDASLTELLEMMHRHVLRLPEDSREVLLLHYYSGKSLREIATLLGISRDAAAKRLQRARAALGEEILKSMSNAQYPSDRNRKRAIGIVTAVVSAGAAWNAGAATAGAAPATLLTAMLKPTLAASVLTAAAFVGFFYYLGASTQTANGVSPAPVAPARQVTTQASAPVPAPEPKSDPQPQPKTEPDRPTSGPGSILANVITAKGGPAVGANVGAELIDWPPFTAAPTTTFKKEAIVDASGQARFQNLPLGLYGVIATNGQTLWGDDFELTAQSPHADTAIQLQPARTLEGTVVSRDGAPVAGATIYPHSSPFFTNIPWAAFATLRVKTDASGAFRRDAALSLLIRYCIVAEGFAPTITGVGTSGTGPLQFVLQNGGTIAGDVVDADSGAPMPGVSLAMEGEHRLEPAIVESGPDGAYKSPTLPVGAYKVVLKEEGYAADAPVTADVNDNAVTAGVQIKVRLGGTISGVVRDKATGEPIVGATVTAGAEGRPTRTSAPSDESGAFVIFGLAKATYGVNAKAEGYFDAGVSAAVEPGAEVDNVDVSLSPGIMLRGRVVESDGRGATNAFVHHVSDTGELVQWKLPITADGDGKFHLLLQPGAEPMWLKAYTPYGSSEIVGPVDVTAPDTLNVVLSANIERTAGIEGTVTNANGDPIPFAFIGVQLEGDAHISAISGKQVWADAAGKFSAGSLHPGLYFVMLDAGSRPVDLRDGQVERDVVLVSGDYSGPPIQGRVTDSAGKPLSDASISVRGPSYVQLTTSPDGAFSIPRISKSDYALEISHPNFSSRYLDAIGEDKTSLTIVLQEHASLDGQVRDAETNQPIAKFELGQFPSNAPLQEYRLRRIDNAEGQFTLSRADSGETALWIRADGYVSELVKLNLAPRADKTVEVSLHPAGSVSGIVLTDFGEPAEDIDVVAVVQDHPEGFHRTRTDKDGKFTLNKLPLQEIGIAVKNGPQEIAIETTPTRNPGEPITITLP